MVITQIPEILLLRSAVEEHKHNVNKSGSSEVCQTSIAQKLPGVVRPDTLYGRERIAGTSENR